MLSANLRRGALTRPDSSRRRRAIPPRETSSLRQNVNHRFLSILFGRFSRSERPF